VYGPNTPEQQLLENWCNELSDMIESAEADFGLREEYVREIERNLKNAKDAAEFWDLGGKVEMSSAAVGVIVTGAAETGSKGAQALLRAVSVSTPIAWAASAVVLWLTFICDQMEGESQKWVKYWERELDIVKNGAKSGDMKGKSGTEKFNEANRALISDLHAMRHRAACKLRESRGQPKY
jgi:hypothetical protein